MERRRNYQRELEQRIDELREAGRVPRLLLHSCCAPCSSYVLEYLSQYFSITDYYCNPNITERDEYEKRAEELARLIAEQPHLHEVRFEAGEYDPHLFFETVRGLEQCREGGERCLKCFELRLRESAARAVRGYTDEDGMCQEYDYFATTLTISPLKNASELNRIGEEIASELQEAGHRLQWLPSDFKKKGGYQRSIELSKEFALYRQNYCGCIFSRREAESRNR